MENLSYELTDGTCQACASATHDHEIQPLKTCRAYKVTENQPVNDLNSHRRGTPATSLNSRRRGTDSMQPAG